MSIGDSKKAPRAAGAGTAGSGAGAAKPAADARAPSATGKQSGRVQFDERGNAVWEWAIATGAFGREVSTERLQKLEHPALSLAEDAPTPFDQVKPNPMGTVKGYNPYDSGKLAKAPETSRKKDLKKLSEWL